jgi:hypothetical protein
MVIVKGNIIGWEVLLQLYLFLKATVLRLFRAKLFVKTCALELSDSPQKT